MGDMELLVPHGLSQGWGDGAAGPVQPHCPFRGDSRPPSPPKGALGWAAAGPPVSPGLGVLGRSHL